MQWSKVIYLCMLHILFLQSCNVNSQDSTFELPVQLVGFPFIIASVRLTNFLKKLSYSLSPETYRSRNRRYSDAQPINVQEVEDNIVSEFGPNACVFERVCATYAVRRQSKPDPEMDWEELYNQYQKSLDQDKEYFLLSVFLGDIIGSPQLCLQLGKRRSCEGDYIHRSNYPYDISK